MEITLSGQQTESQIKKKNLYKRLWDNVKHANLCMIGIPEGKEREKGVKNVFEKLWLKTSQS